MSACGSNNASTESNTQTQSSVDSKEETSSTTTDTTTSDTSSSSTNDVGIVPLFQEDDIMDVTMWAGGAAGNGASQIRWGDTVLGKAVVEKTRIDVVMNYLVGGADGNQAFNLKLADNDWEDCIPLGDKIRIGQMADAGIAVALDEFFDMPDQYPNLAKIPKDVLNVWRHTDGKIYGVPDQWHYDNPGVYWSVNNYYVHPDIAAKVGIDPLSIRNIEDVLNFAIAIKDADLTNDEGLGIIPIANSAGFGSIQTLMSTWGIDVTGRGFSKIQGEWTHWRDNPKYKDVMTFLNQCNRAGVLDKEFTSLTNDMLIERLFSRRVAMYIGGVWPFWGSVTANDTPINEMYPINYPKVQGVNAIGEQFVVSTYGNRIFVPTTTMKDLPRFMRWVDYTSETWIGRVWENFMGVEGELWEWDPDSGEPNFIVKDGMTLQGDVNQQIEYGYFMFFNPCPYIRDLNTCNVSNRDALSWVFMMNDWNSKPENRHYVDSRPSDRILFPSEGEWVNNAPTLNDVDSQYRASLTLASSDSEFESLWDEYMEQLEVKGQWSKVKAEMMTFYKDF